MVKHLKNQAEKYKDIVVFDADLAGATKTINFAKKFPERFFDMGIAESNMMSTAAGMATTGKVHLQVHLQFLQQEEAMIKLEIVFVIQI